MTGSVEATTDAVLPVKPTSEAQRKRAAAKAAPLASRAGKAQQKRRARSSGEGGDEMGDDLYVGVAPTTDTSGSVVNSRKLRVRPDKADTFVTDDCSE